MGIYLNPGNSGFAGIINDEYVDKTGLIELINNSIETPRKLTCISRPRRFGKSYAAQMLCAYYDKTCDSSKLFAGQKIEKEDSYLEYLNKYDVIYLDMTNIIGNVSAESLISFIEDNIMEELLKAYPKVKAGNTFDQTLINVVEHTGNKFIMIIDEWDAPIREFSKIEKEYLRFLRTLFKSSGTTAKIFAAVYMTGILPIKKDGSQSAMSDFKEYSVLDPGAFAEYTGFTEDEVKELCVKNNLNFESAKKWYDGYTLNEFRSIYNPFSVMSAIQNKKFKSYWKKTSAAEALLTYINMNQDGLQEDIIKLISGETIEVDTEGFENDFETFNSKDDVLTLMIHLGYLAYEEVPDTYEDTEEGELLTGIARIPNEEVRFEFNKILRKGQHKKLMQLVRMSDELLKDTMEGKEEKVAEAIERVRDMEYAPNYYNDEQALRYVIKFAYITCVDQYAKIEEMPSGHGIADVVFIPKRRSQLPAMLIELKWNQTSEGAIAQIKDRNYPAVLKNYGGDIILAGINYNEKTKKHTCKIEKFYA